MQRNHFIRALWCVAVAACIVGCGAGAAQPADPNGSAPEAVRPGFLGAFFRPVGTIPFGVFSVYSKQIAPDPYPKPTTLLYGKGGYCDAKAANGVSIATGYVVDSDKLANIVNLGVGWTRTPISSNSDDRSHVFGSGSYAFGDFDSAQCALLRVKILPIVGLENGTVQYNQFAGTFSPKEEQHYRTAADFAGWCSTVARHEKSIFPGVRRFSIPGNEVNSNPQMFPGGDAEIAEYTQACYRAIKAVEPRSTIYGFELNTDKSLDAAAFVKREAALGCKPGTCYDALAVHQFTRYPIPAPETPCYPNPGGNYSVQCFTDIRTASGDPSLHILVGETAFTVPGSVHDEAAKATATVQLMKLLARQPYIDGVNYANVDECDLYPSGFFFDGCLVDSAGQKLPAYDALAKLAARDFPR